MNVAGGFKNKQYSYAQCSCEPINNKQQVSYYCCKTWKKWKKGIIEIYVSQKKLIDKGHCLAD